MFTVYYKSPLGVLEILASNKGITRIDFIDEKEREKTQQENEHLKQCIKELGEYFSGKRQSFGVSLDIEGTAFQQSVWDQLQMIPFGETWVYTELAHKVENPKACRAVGNANGKNPIPIIIPCHRVLAKVGVGGFSAGLWRKEWLLKHEGVLL